jgi:hypothetical protein
MPAAPLSDHFLLHQVLLPFALFVLPFVDPFDEFEDLGEEEGVGIAGDLPHLLPLGVEDHQVGGHFDPEDHLEALGRRRLPEDGVAPGFVPGDPVDVEILRHLVEELHLIQLLLQPFAVGTALRIEDQHYGTAGGLDLVAEFDDRLGPERSQEQEKAQEHSPDH